LRGAFHIRVHDVGRYGGASDCFTITNPSNVSRN
jgi:hypothetical protein